MTKAAITVLLFCVIAQVACEPYRVEYHRRPGYWREVADGGESLGLIR